MLPEDESIAETEKDFPVVGVGASAGGLEAFGKLVASIPRGAGMAYVLVQHLDPNHESILPELLQKKTSVPVVQITDELKVERDHIYIIPSNKTLLAVDDILKLSPREASGAGGRILPIDLFFTSLAAVYGEHSIGIVLSGTGSDGTKGLQRIKEAGGITLAQDLSSTMFKEMPESAIRAAIVDFTLLPETMPLKLMEIKNIITDHETGSTSLPQSDEAMMAKIITLLSVQKGTDFTHYKQTTIRRRLFRRMVLNKQDNLISYYKLLTDNAVELQNLYTDLLIPVTSFFRDTAIINNLCESVFPHLVKTKSSKVPLRIWVAGCSKGQEAYSIAICLKEFLGESRQVQIFATDINGGNIEKARKAVYDEEEILGVSEERRRHFFTLRNGKYTINRDIRDSCTFACHDFLKDPPFGRIDFISCRNVLIYMQPFLQKKALRTFHYALQPHGLLLLGKSETAGTMPELFTFADKRDKIFSRKDTAAPFLPSLVKENLQGGNSIDKDPKTNNMLPDFQKTAEEIMLQKYTPAGVVVNEERDIVYFRGNTGSYLELPAGKPSYNLLKMAKSGLAFELRNILHKVKKQNLPIIKAGIPFLVKGHSRLVTIEAIPLRNVSEPYYLVLFIETPYEQPAVEGKHTARTSTRLRKDKLDQQIEQLEKELIQAREDMRTITEDQEASNEELQSTNEELLSSSEELQTLNEELETSKEELQTMNEELTVVNQELVQLTQALAHSRDYAQSIVLTVRTPLLVLDKDLRIVSANPAFYTTFRVSHSETEGKSIYELVNRQWDIPELMQLLEKILPSKISINDYKVSQDFPGIGKRVMQINGLQIRNENTNEKLILLSFEDITENELLQEKERIFQNELKDKIEAGTKELKLANNELAQQNSNLSKLNKELESFTYISSHDLQEPLRKIQAFANRILTKEAAQLTETGKLYFSRIQDAAGRMQALIKDLLDYSRTTIAERVLEDIDPNLAMEEVKALLAESIKETKAVIHTGELCPARINFAQFRQIMINLITNAIKFSKAEVPPHIDIASEIASGKKLQAENAELAQTTLIADRPYCHISVSDNGIGFDPKYKEQIFEVFQRLYGNDEYPGTGMGLAIVKRIIDNYEGYITATGKPGQGATFDLYFPHDER